MPVTPDEPEGFGTPSGGQPGFAAPPGHPAAPPTNLQQPAARTVHQTPDPSVPPHQWAPPDPGLLVAPPPAGRGPGHARRSRTRWVAALLAAGLVLIGILSALPLVPAIAPTRTPSSAAPVTVDTVTPSARPGSASTSTSGGDLGRPVSYGTDAGKGTVTLRSAVWTDSGEMAPEPGRRYLVLDVVIACTSGAMPIDALMFRATTAEGRQLPGFGPELSDPLGGQVLKPGGTARGQVGYALVPGDVTLEVLDANLKPLAELKVPAP